MGHINLRMSIIYPSKYVKEAAEYKNLELDGEVRTGFINLIVIRLLLTFNAIRLGPGRECGWSGGPKDNPPLRV